MFNSHSYALNTERDEISKSFKSWKVLVVDENKDLLASAASLLDSCSFQATCVDNPGAALRLLFEKENKFDLLLIDRDITGFDVRMFIRIAENMDLLSMVMCEEDDDATVLKAFRSGAAFVYKRPITIDDVMHMRQCVIKDVFRKQEERRNKSMTQKATVKEESIEDDRSFKGTVYPRSTSF